MTRPSAPSRPRARLSAAEVAAAVGQRHTPTPEQVAVIEAPLAPLLVVAGAGSGKTETMAARVVWLVANGLVQPDQVLGLTFTRKAAGELADRIGARLRRLTAAGLWAPTPDEHGAEALDGSPTVSTYHSYAGRLVREHALRLGVEPDSRLLTEAAAWQYAAEAVARYDGDMSEVPNAESTTITAVVDLAGEMAEHLLSVDDVRAELDRVVAAIDATPPAGKSAALPADVLALRAVLRARRAVLPIVEDFQRLKRSRDALDFADQVALAARLAATFPDLGRAERSRFRAVLLDEFQDTSEAQLELLRSLFVAAGEPVPVTAVGDPHQSIYGWRGASASTLARFPVEFAERAADAVAPGEVAGAVDSDRGRADSRESPRTDAGPRPTGRDRSAAVVALSTTWRNDAAILRVANHVAAPLRESARVPVVALSGRPDAGPGDVEVARLGTHLQEAAYIARWLRQARGRAGVTAAVLCRKRSQFGPMMEALEAEGVPFEVVGLGGLLLTPEILDLVSALRVVADPNRGDALMRLVTGPSCRLGAADLDGLHEWARFRQRVLRAEERGELALDLDPAGRDEDDGLADTDGRLVDLAPEVIDEPSIVEALDDLPPVAWRGPDGQRIDPGAVHRLAGLAAAIRRLRSLSGLPLADLVGEAERALGLDLEVLARPDYTPVAARAHLDAFADVAADFSTAADRPTLDGFLAWLDAAVAEERGLDAAPLEPAPDAVQILTVHAAKGLEWDVVAVPGLVEGTFPAMEHAPHPSHDGQRWQVGDPRPAGWTGGLSGVPYALRGDADGLPVLRYRGLADGKALEAARQDFRAQEGRRELDEERRLAYVAMTRARRRLLLTAHVWAATTRHKITSRFLREVVRARAELEVRRVEWAPMPSAEDPGTTPVAEEGRSVLWPVAPESARVAAAERAARAVAAAHAEAAGALASGSTAQWSRGTVFEPEAEPESEAGDGPVGGSAYERAALVGPTLPRGGDPRDPYAADVAALLAERRAERAPRSSIVELPRHLSTSDVVALATDAVAFAERVRRPMPTEPALAARRGTAFHAWVEQHYARASLLDLTDLPGAADDVGDSGEAELPGLKARFLASEWAQREPIDVEVAIETVLDGIAVRGRIDAVFARPGGGVTIVDWKTGPVPSGDAAQVRAVQLGTYALAYARLRGLAPEAVEAAFYYARTGETVRPQLPDEAELLALLRRIGD